MGATLDKCVCVGTSPGTLPTSHPAHLTDPRGGLSAPPREPGLWRTPWKSLWVPELRPVTQTDSSYVPISYEDPICVALP